MVARVVLRICSNSCASSARICSASNCSARRAATVFFNDVLADMTICSFIRAVSRSARTDVFVVHRNIVIIIKITHIPTSPLVKYCIIMASSIFRLPSRRPHTRQLPSIRGHNRTTLFPQANFEPLPGPRIAMLGKPADQNIKNTRPSVAGLSTRRWDSDAGLSARPQYPSF